MAFLQFVYIMLVIETEQMTERNLKMQNGKLLKALNKSDVFDGARPIVHKTCTPDIELDMQQRVFVLVHLNSDCSISVAYTRYHKCPNNICVYERVPFDSGTHDYMITSGHTVEEVVKIIETNANAVSLNF